MQVFKNVLQPAFLKKYVPFSSHNVITSPKSVSPEKKSYRVAALLVLSTLWVVSSINSWEGEVVTPKWKGQCNRNPIHPMNNNNFFMVF